MDAEHIQLPKMGTKEHIIYPYNEVDYEICGLPSSWMNARNYEECRIWYETNCPFLTEEIMDACIKEDLANKIKFFKEL